MRFKYNVEEANDVNNEKSYIWRFFHEEMETVLNPDTNSIHEEFNLLYVNLPSVEEKLQEFNQHMVDDRCVFLTGVTGAGKSSLLCYLFQIERERVHIDDSTLYIPFTFDHRMLERQTILDYFIAIIKNAYELVLERVKKESLEESRKGLYEYIKSILSEALNYSDGDEAERLQALEEKAPLEYHMLRLKYLLSVYKKINNVVLIVDDIEALGYEMELVPIDFSMILWCCLKNQPKNKPRMWSSGLIISCRHYVYRMLRTRQLDHKYIVKSYITSQTLESYPLNNEVNISTPVSLIDIVNKRVSILKNKYDKNRWEEARKIVEYILTKIDKDFGDFIVAICIGNLRSALSLLKELIYNKRWIQRDWKAFDGEPGAFSIEHVGQFNLSPPCILRAICLGEGNVYDSTMSDVPNIMYNTANESSDLITLIVLRAFMKLDGNSNYDWRNTVERDEIENELKSIISDSEIHKQIDRSVKHLIKSRLLLRGQTQAQDDGIDLNDDLIDDIKIVYASRAAYLLWQQLKRSSVLYELYTDDIFIDYETIPLSARRSFLVFDQNTYERCLSHLRMMIKVEGNLRIDAKNAGNLGRLNDLIGSDFITRQLLDGLTESQRKYYRNDSETYIKILRELNNAITEYRAMLFN